jgi:hypothetical protein
MSLLQDNVYNILFASRELQKRAAEKWPQEPPASMLPPSDQG